MKNEKKKIKKSITDNNINKLRKLRGLTAKELSAKTKLGVYTIYRYEWGWLKLGNANFLTICKLCKALQCKPSELFNDTNIIDYLVKIGM